MVIPQGFNGGNVGLVLGGFNFLQANHIGVFVFQKIEKPFGGRTADAVYIVGEDFHGAKVQKMLSTETQTSKWE